MSKVTWASTLLWSLVGLTAFTQAQQPRSHRLVIIAAEKLRHTPPQIIGLRDGLKKQGFTDGKNLVIDLLQEETYERLDSSLKKFISQHRIEVIVVLSEADTVFASNITDKIPIVFLPAARPCSGRARKITGASRNKPHRPNLHGRKRQRQTAGGVQGSSSISTESRRPIGQSKGKSNQRIQPFAG